MATQRQDPDRHRAQVRAANRARYRAVKRLIDENPRRFDELYAEEAALEGVTPKPPERVDAGKIKTQIATLQERLNAIRG
jgi:hypothetical protein